MEMTRSEKIEFLKDFYKKNGCHYTLARVQGLKLGFTIEEINRILNLQEKKRIRDKL